MHPQRSFNRMLEELQKILKSCRLCPRHCLVDRTSGGRGFCGLTDQVRMDSALAHHGEEPPLSGTRGAGTIFLSSCNLHCIYCQNYQISHCITGEALSAEALAMVMLSLQERGCHNIEPVTPTPHLPATMEALVLARERGLNLPFVYNCGGYEDPEIIKMLSGMVDIYLPDFKYGSEEAAHLLSDAKDYPQIALDAISEMVKQVGDSLEMDSGVARRGIIIRHLVLPGMVDNSLEALRLLVTNISTHLPLSIMSQYTPMPAVRHHPLLRRRVTKAEYDGVINYALKLGFENIFYQEVDNRQLTPDFNNEDPFSWNNN